MSKGAMGMVSLLIYRSVDSEGNFWELVKPDDVPLWIKHDPEMVARLKTGDGAQAPDSEQWFIAIPMDAQPVKGLIEIPKWAKV